MKWREMVEEKQHGERLSSLSLITSRTQCKVYRLCGRLLLPKERHKSKLVLIP